jgi:branched-chain amino acid transport system permease protein
MNADRIYARRRPLLVEAITAIALLAAPFVLGWFDAAPNTVNRILVWGLFGIGFDILFGYTGLLSFGQSALYGTGGMVAAYLLTRAGFPHVITALVLGTMAAAAVGYLVGLVALKRTGIYFAMITIAIAEVFFFVEFNPLSEWTGGENGLPGVPTPVVNFGFTTVHFTSGWALYPFLAFCYFLGIVIALRIVRSPVGAVLRAVRENPLRAAAVGHNVHGYKLTAFVIAAAYAGLAGGLLGMMQGFMPPDAFMFDTSGQLVMQTAIGGRGTLFGPLVGASVWLFLQDFLQATLKLGSTWKLVLGLVFVLLVCFLRQGIIGGLRDLSRLFFKRSSSPERSSDAQKHVATPLPPRRRTAENHAGPILEARGLTKHYGGIYANENIDFSVARGELRGIIGPTAPARARSSRCSPARWRRPPAGSCSRAATSPT